MKSEVLEHDIQNEIRAWCGEHDILAFRVNTGKGYTPDGRIFSTGVPKGFPDVLGLAYGGKTIFIECKAQYGRLRPEQKTLHEELRKRGFVVLVPHSFDEFVNEMKGIGYGN